MGLFLHHLENESEDQRKEEKEEETHESRTAFQQFKLPMFVVFHSLRLSLSLSRFSIVCFTFPIPIISPS